MIDTEGFILPALTAFLVLIILWVLVF